MGAKNFDEPSEVQSIKTFVRKNLSSDVAVSVAPNSITITAASASLAGSLRPQLYKMKDELNIDKKVFIRIG